MGQPPSLSFPFLSSLPFPTQLTSCPLPSFFLVPSPLFFLPSSSGSTKLMSSKSQTHDPERPQVFLQPSRDSSTPFHFQPFPGLRGPELLLKGQLYPTHLPLVS